MTRACIREQVPADRKIHSRDIRLATYPYRENSIIVEGFLKDERYLPVFDITGDVKPAGVIHHFGIWLTVDSDPLMIRDAEAEMITLPMTECRALADSVAALAGLEIRSGFSRKVRDIMGGPDGCTHLCHLATVMIQEVVQGFFVRKRQTKPPLPSSVDTLDNKEMLIDSCRMWKPDGPKINALERAIKRAGGR